MVSFLFLEFILLKNRYCLIQNRNLNWENHEKIQLYYYTCHIQLNSISNNLPIIYWYWYFKTGWTNFTSNQLDDKSFPVIKQVRQGSAASRRIEFVIPLENNNIQKKLVGELLGKYITGYQDKFIITKDPGTLAF